MVTQAQLESEQVWHDQIVPPFMTAFLITPLRNFYGLDANSCGAPGDNNHLYGRHRSANWDLTSRYCTNRTYGTKDARDKLGNLNWYRAVDVGITGQKLYDASHRLDNAVRAGQLPEVAEWFGTFDGVTVVGWYEGHASSSDSSHLTHLHTGIWNEFADHFQVMQRIYAVITGQGQGGNDMPVFVHCAQNGGFYAYGLGDPKWFTSTGAYNKAREAFGNPAPIEMPTLDAVRDAFGYIPGDAAAVAAGLADVLTDEHGNVIPPTCDGGDVGPITVAGTLSGTLSGSVSGTVSGTVSGSISSV